MTVMGAKPTSSFPLNERPLIGVAHPKADSLLATTSGRGW
jgi:hypothetical protein